MGLDYRNLDDRTRQLMLAEIDRDIAASTLYLSDNLSDRGKGTRSRAVKHECRTWLAS